MPLSTNNGIEELRNEQIQVNKNFIIHKFLDISSLSFNMKNVGSILKRKKTVLLN